MKRITPMLNAVAAVVLTACLPAVNPFYTANDIVFEPARVGEWTQSISQGQSEGIETS